MGISINLNSEYVKRIDEIKKKLGINSRSEVVRRAIDEYALKLGIIK